MPFESHLELRHRPGHQRWEVIEPLHYRHYTQTPALPTGYQPRASQLIVVPVGYLSDLASIPRMARRLVDRQSPTTRPPRHTAFHINQANTPDVPSSSRAW